MDKEILQCKEKEGASDKDLKELINDVLPTTKEGKCLNACVMELVGIVNIIGI